MNSTKFHRVWIYGSLTTQNTLHIGSGDVEPFEGEEGHYSTVCLDKDHKPYLPASSLRGFLAQVAEYYLQSSDCKELFGFMENDEGQAGQLYIYDAVLRQAASFPTEHSQIKQEFAKCIFEETNTLLRSATSLNPILGVVDEHHLFHLQVVPAGSVFDVKIMLNQVDKEVDEDRLISVLELLTSWDGSTQSALGAGGGKGHGRITWDLEQVQVLDSENLEKWLKSADHSLEKHYRVLDKLPELKSLPQPTGLQLKFELIPHGSFLLHDPNYVDTGAKGTPKIAYSRTPEGHALIPATALRGWVRGRVRRILLTLLMQQKLELTQAIKKADKLVKEIFGDEGRRGKVWFDDAVSATVTAVYPQTFNAVDRFTGGVAETALFSVEGARCEKLSGAVWLRESLEAWQQGILLLVVRDMLEGELGLGWGKSRGYGSFSVELTVGEQLIKNYSDLTNLVDNEMSKQWLTALASKIQE
jgi:CRISPR/Cas system CSM-associated protein Csm3 (group 7 of RAMP superfamily)